MKTGIIITFHNNEKDIDKDFFVTYLNKVKGIEICLVNNDSKDQTYQILKEIAEYCNNVSIVNIKKQKMDMSAVRAGVRFMTNKFNLKEIGYVSVNLLDMNQNNLNDFINTIIDNQESIFNHNTSTFQNYTVKKTLFQRLFSLKEFLEKSKTDNKVLNLQD